jgi:hypothetical protein
MEDRVEPDIRGPALGPDQQGGDLPRGREARNAWRALSPQAREVALAAARQGVAPPDVGIAWAAAGYGRTMARRLRVVRLFAPLIFLVLAVPAGVVLALVRASALTAQMALFPLGAVVIVGLIPLMRQAGRYQRLYSSGLLGLQAAGLGMLVPQSSPAVWSAAQSEFTVPYEARVPVVQPPAHPTTGVAPAGTREIPVRRGPVLVTIGLFGAIGLIFWLAALALAAGPGGALGAAPVIVFALAETALVGYLLWLTWPALRGGVLARFTPEGWELPPSRMAGSWAQVRAIRVRPFAARGPAAANPQLAAYRVVALIVDDPERHLARLSSARRALVRRTMKRYGSPVVIVASPRRTIPLVELVQLLQRYTDAPVTWS